MRVLITGAAGFIGSHLAERLQEHELWCLDNFETSRRIPVDNEIWALENPPPIELIDIADRRRFYEFANQARPELVIHCAASYSDPDKWHRDVDTNIIGTINTINVARFHEAKLVYFQTALPPVSSYAISKIAGQRYIEASGLPALVFRLANVYGPRNLSGPIPAFYKRLSAGEPCTAVRTSRDMVYVSDLVECVLLALEQGATGNFDVCSGQAAKISALYDEVASHFSDAPEAKTIAPPPGDVPTELSLEARFPGWSSSTPLPEGIAQAVEWYRANGVGETYTHLKV